MNPVEVEQLRNKLWRTEQHLKSLESTDKVNLYECDESSTSQSFINDRVLGVTKNNMLHGITNLHNNQQLVKKQQHRSTPCYRDIWPDDLLASSEEKPHPANFTSSTADSFHSSDGEVYRKRLHKLRNENSLLTQQKNELMSEVERSESELHNANSQILSVEEQLNQFRSLTSKTDERLSFLTKELDVKESVISNLSKQSFEMQNLIDGMQREIDISNNKIEELENRLKKEDLLKNRLKQERDNAIIGLDAVQNDLQLFQEKSAQKIDQFQKNESNMKSSLLESEKTQYNLKKEIKSLQTEIKNKNSEKKSFQLIEKENVELRQEMNKKLFSIADLEKDLVSLKALKSDNEEYKESINVLTNSLQETEMKLDKALKDLNQSEKQVLIFKKTFKKQLSCDSGVLMVSTKSENSESVVNNLNLSDPFHGFVADGLEVKLREALEHNKDVCSRNEELERIIDKLEAEQMKQTAHVMNLEERLSDEEVKNSSVDTRLTQRNSQIADLQKELIERTTEMGNLERNLRKKAVQISNIERKLDDKSEEVANYLSQIGSLTEKLTDKTKEGKTLEKKMAKLNAQVSDSNVKIEEMKQLHNEQCSEINHQRDSLQVKYDALREENTQTKKLLKEHESLMLSTQQDMQVRSETDTDTIHKLEAELKQSSVVREQLDSMLSLAKQEIKLHVDKLQAEKINTDQLIKEKTLIITEQTKDLSDLRKLLSDKDQTIESLNQTLSHKQNLLSQANLHASKLESTQQNLESELSEIKNNIRKTKQEMSMELDATEQARNLSEFESEKKTHEICRLQQFIRAGEERLSDMSHDAEKLRTQLIEEREEKEQLETRISSLINELKSHKTNVKSLEEQVEQKEISINNMNDEIQDHLSQKDHLTNQLSQAKTSLKDALREAHNIQILCEEKSIALKTVQTDLDHTKQQLRNTQEEASSRKQEMDSQNEALAQRQNELQERSVQISMLDDLLQQHRAHAEKENLLINTTLKKTQIELEEKSRHISLLDSQIEELKNVQKDKGFDLQESHQLSERLKHELQLRTTLNQTLKKELSDLNSKFDEANTVNINLMEELKLSRKEFNSLQAQSDRRDDELHLQRNHISRLEKEIEELKLELTGKNYEVSRKSAELEKIYSAEQEKETKNMSEIEKLQQELIKCKTQYQTELEAVRDAHVRMVASKEHANVQQKQQLRQNDQKLASLGSELELTRTELRRRREAEISHKQHIETVTQTIAIKNSEIEKLQSRILSLTQANEMLQSMQNNLQKTISLSLTNTAALKKLDPPALSNYNLLQNFVPFDTKNSMINTVSSSKTTSVSSPKVPIPAQAILDAELPPPLIQLPPTDNTSTLTETDENQNVMKTSSHSHSTPIDDLIKMYDTPRSQTPVQQNTADLFAQYNSKAGVSRDVHSDKNDKPENFSHDLPTLPLSVHSTEQLQAMLTAFINKHPPDSSDLSGSTITVNSSANESGALKEIQTYCNINDSTVDKKVKEKYAQMSPSSLEKQLVTAIQDVSASTDNSLYSNYNSMPTSQNVTNENSSVSKTESSSVSLSSAGISSLKLDKNVNKIQNNKASAFRAPNKLKTQSTIKPSMSRAASNKKPTKTNKTPLHPKECVNNLRQKLDANKLRQEELTRQIQELEISDNPG